MVLQKDEKKNFHQESNNKFREEFQQSKASCFFADYKTFERCGGIMSHILLSRIQKSWNILKNVKI
jgi:hypothetical protein